MLHTLEACNTAGKVEAVCKKPFMLSSTLTPAAEIASPCMTDVHKQMNRCQMVPT